MAVKFNDGTFGQGQEWLHDILYDRYILASAGPLNTQLFRSATGLTRNSVVLGMADTNVTSNSVPVKNKWYLWQLKFIYQAIALRNDAAVQLILNWLRTTIISLTIQNLATMFQFPLSYFLPGDQYVNQPAATVNTNVPRGTGTEQWDMKVPIVLEENAVWWVDITETAANDAALNGDYALFAWDREMFRQGA